MRRPRDHAFTIVELMVVVSIIGLLMGLLLPALNSVRMRSKKTEELSLIRQVGLSWTLYANNYNDYVLPGFLETDAQDRWGVRYEYPDHALIPPAPNYGPSDNFAGPWTWRLAPYFDFNHKVIHGYRGEAETDIFSMINESDEVAYKPAFGYNAYYCGGWMKLFDDGLGHPVKHALWDSRSIDTNLDTIEVVVDAVARIRRPAEFITFCSAATPDKPTFKKLPDSIDGLHYIVPPTIATTPIWDWPESRGIKELIQAVGFVDGISPIPCGRYTGQAAVLRADCSVDSQTPGALKDQRLWINVADTPDYTHTSFSWTP